MTPGAIHLGQFRIPADHPSLPGHFPGQPLVPGALLLDEAAALLQAHRPATHLAQVVTCKFLLPVRPSDAVDVYRESADAETVTLSCVVGTETVLRGRVRLSVE